MKITKATVGQKITKEEWGEDYYVIVLCVGGHSAFVRYKSGYENVIPLSCAYEFELYEEPKKVKLMAPCIYNYAYVGGKKLYGLSERLFESLDEAKEVISSAYVQWPAIPNKDGFYEVEVD